MDIASKWNVSLRRWWLLAFLCFISNRQCDQWGTFTVLAVKVKSEYGWSNATVNLLTLWGPLCYLPCAVFTPSLLQRCGMRRAITLSAFLVALGSLLRCLIRRRDSPLCLALAHLGQIANAMGGPLLLSTPALLSAQWFPLTERITATTLAVASNYSGTLVCYATLYLFEWLPPSMMSVLILLRIECAIAMVAFLVCIIDEHLWPSLPDLPPSTSQKFLRNERKEGQTAPLTTAVSSVSSSSAVSLSSAIPMETLPLSSIWRESNLQRFAVLYGCYGGVISGYSAILTPIFASDSIDLSQSTIGLLGMAMIAGVMIGSVGFSRVQDWLQSHSDSAAQLIQRFMVGLVTVSGLCLLLFSFLVLDYSHHHSNALTLAAAVVSLVVGCVLNAGTYGLGYEVAVELVFPHYSEVTAGALLTAYFNVFAGATVVLQLLVSSSVMLFFAPILTVICGLLLMCYQPRSVRNAMDTGRLHSMVAAAEDEENGPSLGGFVTDEEQNNNNHSRKSTNTTRRLTSLTSNDGSDTGLVTIAASYGSGSGGVEVAFSSDSENDELCDLANERFSSDYGSRAVSVRSSRQVSRTAPLSLGEYTDVDSAHSATGAGVVVAVALPPRSGSGDQAKSGDSEEERSSLNPTAAEPDVWM